MAAVAGPATPHRPLPGAFLTTPAPPPTIFAQNAQMLRQQQQQQQHPTAHQNTTAGQSSQTSQAAPSISAIERAARTLNDTLAHESRFPQLEDYVIQGISGDCELPSNPAWNPFQAVKSYDLPPRILEQANNSGVGLTMGLFAPLGHQWAAMDNSLYLWDYTVPNAELIGWEENAHTITSVKLVKPKPGVFVKEITHVIVIATTVEMLLLGVANTTTQTGAKTISLYNTRMSIPVRGLSVSIMAASEKTGRIFFTGSTTPDGDDIFEFQYQQEEGWFRGKCRRIDHTNTGTSYIGTPKLLTQIGWAQQKQSKQIIQMVIDDTRNLLYSLSNTSELKIWLIKDNLVMHTMRPFASLLQNVGHYSAQRSELLYGQNVRLVSVSPIPATEASRYICMATTNTGCRLYISALTSSGYYTSAASPPSSVQVTHIRYPPTDPNAPSQQPTNQPQQSGGSAQSSAMQNYQNPAAQLDTTSKYLNDTHLALRQPPGYFLAFIPDPARQGADRVFCSAPDSARLKNPQDSSQLNSRFKEHGQWLSLPAEAQQILLVGEEYPGGGNGTAGVAYGFGNELALQFDQPVTELAVLTQLGMTHLRRRRLVDMFASLMRSVSSTSSASEDEGPEAEVKRFVRAYGRAETAATALAVACGQGVDVNSADERVASITDPEVLERARKVFIEQGGRPEFNLNAAQIDGGDAVDSVRPSPRHDGLGLYISRVVRSVWSSKVLKEEVLPGEPVQIISAVDVPKLRSVQRDLNELKRFLQSNKSFIEGLSGPQALGRLSTRQEEIALQGEHRAMNSLVRLLESLTEGIAFALVLFDEPIQEILLMLGSDESRRKAKELTYQALVVTTHGRELGKELVKAIVNRNITAGSNVDTVAEALRRRCGSFCSADDVVIFKAQEQVKRAQEAGAQTETGRVLLNESQRLFAKVAGSLSQEHLEWAVSRYVEMEFYAGAIQLCLVVAAERDRAKRGVAWVKEGKPEGDERQAVWEKRQLCYTFIFAATERLDAATTQAAAVGQVDGQYNVAARRRDEAYDVINGSDDVAFQTALYDWYLEKGQPDRLLESDNSYVVDYLRAKSQTDLAAADLLWRYFAHNNAFLEAAAVQLDMARGFFDLRLSERIGYLSRARTHASTRSSALTFTPISGDATARQGKQQLLRSIDDLLEVANIQDDILTRMKNEPRLTGQRRVDVLRDLDGQILSIADLFNQYADQAGYHDICILIYAVADHRNPADIRVSWQALIEQTDREAQLTYGRRQARPWEAVGEQVRELGKKLHVADATFPIQTLLPMLERYAIEPHHSTPPPHWSIDIFLELDVPHETLLPVLEQIYYGNEQPFVGSKRRIIGGDMVYLLQRWCEDSERRGERVVFGGEENASLAVDMLQSLVRGGDALDASARAEAEELLGRVIRALR